MVHLRFVNIDCKIVCVITTRLNKYSANRFIPVATTGGRLLSVLSGENGLAGDALVAADDADVAGNKRTQTFSCIVVNSYVFIRCI